MKIWHEIDYFEARNPVVTIGIFDGVHKGHQFLINELKKKAEEIGGESVVLTLWPHPRTVLGKNAEKLRYLTNLDEKTLLLKNEGIDHLVIIPFTPEFSQLDSCSFVKEYLVDRLKIRHLLVGYNHRFGKDREGNFESLKNCADRYGFDINRIDPLNVPGEKLSSSHIRQLFEEGELEKGNECLGYDYFLIGRVVEGNRIGRSIGFPTANIELEDRNKLLPRTGVYAVHLSCEGKIYKGMLNIGYRPTIENPARRKTIEVHLFDFNEDLYHKKVALAFRKRMRDEIKFESLEELRKQLENDRRRAFDILDKKP